MVRRPIPVRTAKSNVKHPRQKIQPLTDALNDVQDTEVLLPTTETRGSDEWYDVDKESLTQPRRGSDQLHHTTFKSISKEAVNISFIIDETGNGPKVHRSFGEVNAYAECIMDYMSSAVRMKAEEPSPFQNLTPSSVQVILDSALPSDAQAGNNAASDTSSTTETITVSTGLRSSRRKRSAPAHESDTEGPANETIKQMADMKRWSKKGTLVAGETDKILDFFTNRFLVIGQSPCKKINIAVIDAIWKSRQGRKPYRGSAKGGRWGSSNDPDRHEQTPPPFWPADVRYQGSHRLVKEERMRIMSHLYALPVVMPEQSKIIISGKPYGRPYESWERLLDSIFDSNIQLKDKGRVDEENNNRRHRARVEAIQELNRVAGELEKWMSNEHRDPNEKIQYSALPRDISLTQSAAAAAKKKKRVALPPSGITREGSTHTMDTIELADAQSDAGMAMVSGQSTTTDNSHLHSRSLTVDMQLQQSMGGARSVISDGSGGNMHNTAMSSASTSFSSSLAAYSQDEQMNISTGVSFNGTEHSFHLGTNVQASGSYMPGVQAGYGPPVQDALIAPVAQRHPSTSSQLRPNFQTTAPVDDNAFWANAAHHGGNIRRSMSVCPPAAIPSYRYKEPNRTHDDQTVAMHYENTMGPSVLYYSTQGYVPALHESQFHPGAVGPYMFLPPNMQESSGPYPPPQQGYPIQNYPTMVYPPSELPHEYHTNGAPMGQFYIHHRYQ